MCQQVATKDQVASHRRFYTFLRECLVVRQRSSITNDPVQSTHTSSCSVGVRMVERLKVKEHSSHIITAVCSPLRGYGPYDLALANIEHDLVHRTLCPVVVRYIAPSQPSLYCDTLRTRAWSTAAKPDTSQCARRGQSFTQ